jgi:hypothetical protein
MQSGAIDLSGREDLDGHPRRTGENSPEELLSLLGSDLLGVVQLRERTYAVVAQRVVVEKDAGND